jgi:hypothetical protein
MTPAMTGVASAPKGGEGRPDTGGTWGPGDVNGDVRISLSHLSRCIQAGRKGDPRTQLSSLLLPLLLAAAVAAPCACASKIVQLSGAAVANEVRDGDHAQVVVAGEGAQVVPAGHAAVVQSNLTQHARGVPPRQLA